MLRCGSAFGSRLQPYSTPIRIAMLLAFVGTKTGYGTPLIYVDVNALGPTHDGATWCSALKTLDAALASATPGQTIRVARGTYRPDPTGLQDPREATFRLPPGVAVWGGYAGCTAPDPDQRNVYVNATILSGDLAGDDASPFVNRAENVYHVLLCDSTSSGAVLDGFTVTGGNATESTPDQDVGGGMLIPSGDCTVRNCIFRENAAGHSEPTRSCCCPHPTPGCEPSACESDVCTADPACCVGPWDNHCASLAGTFCFLMCFPPSGCDPTLTGGGAGIYIENSSGVIEDSSFESNLSNRYGGGIWNHDGDPSLTNCSFRGNSALDAGGGLASDGASNPTVRDCRFVDNKADLWGGGVSLGPTFSTSLIGCVFQRNRSFDGAGLALLGDPDAPSSPLVLNTRFLGNADEDALGGGVFASNTNAEFVNCVFSGNRGFAGGGLFVVTASIFFDSTPLVTNCAFTRNVATFVGGGIYNDANTTVNNTIFWHNTDRDHGNAEAAQLHAKGSGLPVVNYSIIQNRTGTAVWDGVGNLGADPRFANETGLDGIPGTEDDNLHLRFGSPAVDRGINAALPVTVTTDLAGATRIVDGDGDSVSIIDIGPYELPAFPGSIPLMSTWGFAVLTLLTLIAGSVVLSQRNGVRVPPPSHRVEQTKS